MANKIAKFSLEDEKLLLSEMEMLEVYGGAASPGNYQVQNGCRCQQCGTGNTKETQVVAQCGNCTGNETNAYNCSGTTGSSQGTGGGN